MERASVVTFLKEKEPPPLVTVLYESPQTLVACQAWGHAVQEGQGPGKGQEGCVHGVKLLIHQEGQVQAAAGGGQGTLGWGLGRSEPSTLCWPPGRVYPPPLPPTLLRTPGWREPRNLGDPYVMTARAGDPAHGGWGHLRRGLGGVLAG